MCWEHGRKQNIWTIEVASSSLALLLPLPHTVCSQQSSQMILLKSQAHLATPLHRGLHWLPGGSFLRPRSSYMASSLFTSDLLPTAAPSLRQLQPAWPPHNPQACPTPVPFHLLLHGQEWSSLREPHSPLPHFLQVIFHALAKRGTPESPHLQSLHLLHTSYPFLP